MTEAKLKPNNPTKAKLIGVVLGFALASAPTTHAQTVETGMVKLADSNIQYFSRGKPPTITLVK